MGEKSPEWEEEMAEIRRSVLEMMDRTRQEIQSFRDDLKEIKKESEKTLESLMRVLSFSIRYSGLNSLVMDVLLAVRTLQKGPGASKDVISSTLREIVKFFNEFSGSPPFAKITLDASTSFIGTLIAAARLDTGISFDELASILIDSIPDEIAKRIVPLEDMTRYYGTENAIKWKKLVGIQ